jgi:hypothetical protein
VRLLEAAQRYVDQSEPDYRVALIVAQTACEVVIQRAVAKAFAAKGLSAEQVESAMSICSWSLIEGKPRALYKAITGDDTITDKSKSPFWKPYQESVELRNLAVHRGQIISEAEAKTGLDAARALVDHVATHNGLKIVATFSFTL